MQKVIKPIKLLFDGFFTALIQRCSSVSLQSEELLESRLLGAQYLVIDSHECPNQPKIASWLSQLWVSFGENQR